MLATSAGLTGALIGFPLADRAVAADVSIRVLSARPPMPAPPGVASYSDAAFKRWQRVHRTNVTYEPVSWRELERILGLTLPSGSYHHDLVYVRSQAAALRPHLSPMPRPLAPIIANDLLLKIPTSPAPDRDVQAIRSTTSLLICWWNSAIASQAGFATPPATWEELRDQATTLTSGETLGIALNLAPAAGVGSIASVWMALLQQAGGTMWREDGTAAFNDDAGRFALEFLVGLVPLMPPACLTDRSAMDTAIHMVTGKAAITLGWPSLWPIAQDPTMSVVRGQLQPTMMPAGPAGTASIDGSGGWAIPAMAREPDAAFKLIEFFLDATVQKEQTRMTGWLPARRSVLADPDLQSSFPHAAVVLQQAGHPHESFLTEDFDRITLAMGEAFHRAFTGNSAVRDALDAAETAVNAIVADRPS